MSNMATINEIWVVEPLEGKTRREQLQRLAEWREKFLAEGASQVDIWEGGYGDFNGSWMVCIMHESAQAYGEMTDKYFANAESFDNAMEIWQQTPVFNFRSGGLVHLLTS